jgi:hypothetical protein
MFSVAWQEQKSNSLEKLSEYYSNSIKSILHLGKFQFFHLQISKVSISAIGVDSAKPDSVIASTINVSQRLKPHALCNFTRSMVLPVSLIFNSTMLITGTPPIKYHFYKQCHQISKVHMVLGKEKEAQPRVGLSLLTY